MCKGKKNCSCKCNSKNKEEFMKESATKEQMTKLETDYDSIRNDEFVTPENDVEKKGYTQLIRDGYLQYYTDVDRNEEGEYVKSKDYYYDYGNFHLSLSEFLTYFDYDDDRDDEERIYKAMFEAKNDEIDVEKDISKINLKCDIKQKKELLKQTKTASDALLKMYDIANDVDIKNEKFLDLIDKASDIIENISTICVIQD